MPLKVCEKSMMHRRRAGFTSRTAMYEETAGWMCVHRFGLKRFEYVAMNMPGGLMSSMLSGNAHTGEKRERFGSGTESLGSVFNS